MKLAKILARFSLLIFIFTILITSNSFAQNSEECTIGVASGKATTDGRPLLWKTRDTSEKDNEVKYNTSYKYNFISVVDAGGTYAWMGVNEKGFAIMNSVSSDLPAGTTGVSSGELMRNALGNYATVAEFEQMLISTNSTGRRGQANFGVIDSTGAAAIFETGGNEFWKFDANDSTVSPNGYVLRTNFAFNGDAQNGLNDGIYSIERYRRQVELMNSFHEGDSLNYRSILRTQMRDFSDNDSDPVPVPFPKKWQSNRPYGYIYCYVSICRSTSVSATVIQGVLPEEPAKLSTMWTMLGQPASSITVPYWPVGKTPNQADGSSTAPLCDAANQLRSILFDYTDNTSYIDSYKLRNDNGFGIWSYTFQAEDSIFAAAENLLSQWRTNGMNMQEMLNAESDYAQYALATLQEAYTSITTSVQPMFADQNPTEFQLLQNYPNPFNAATTIQFSLTEPSNVNLAIFNSLGEIVTSLAANEFNAGQYHLNWDASNISSGIYFYRLESRPVDGSLNKSNVETKRMVLLK